MRAGLGLLVVLAAVAAGSAYGASLPPPPNLPAGGPRATYEQHLGQPPRVWQPTGHLGHTWTGDPTYVANASTYSHGEFVYTDTPFDDTGADTEPDADPLANNPVLQGLCGSGDTYRNGEYAYPSDAAYGGNAADLIEWRLAADSSWYYTVVGLETLIQARTTNVSILIDADGLPGYEHTLRIAGVGTSGASANLDGATEPSAVDLTENTFEAKFPVGAIPPGLWRVAVQVGTDTGAITDLAFVEEQIAGTFNCWSDRSQSALITAGTWPARQVDVAKLLAGATDAPTLVRGPMVRVQRPSFDLGEGIITQPKYDTADRKIYMGRVQPYAAYVPSTYDPSHPNPLILLLHCLNCNHNTFHIAAWPGLTQLAESRGAPIVTPLAYGEGGHYEEEAEWDVFDVLSDVRARYNIDPDRIYLTGMSMGALGTFRIGLLYPDLWARALSIGNYTNPNCVTPSQANPPPGYCASPYNYYTLIDSARNIPWGLVNGVLDELTPITGAREIADRFDALGYPYRLWEYTERFHEPRLHGQTTDVTDPFFGNYRRIASPARVTFVMERPMELAAWKLVHDRAYWVRGVTLAAAVNRGTVDAVSGRGTTYTTTPVSGSGTSEAGPYNMRGRDPTFSEKDAGNTLALTLRGIGALTIDLAQAKLTLSSPLTLDVDTDSNVTLTLTGRAAPLTFPPGVHHVVIGSPTAVKVSHLHARRPGRRATPSLLPHR